MGKVPSKAEKRRMIIFLSLVTVSSLTFGFLYIKYQLSNPFVELVESRTLSYKEEQLKKIVALRTQDSDKDGLVDYDELYQYNTSPYLADSDSDGFSDKEEIETGNNPNCLAGHICEQERIDINTNRALTLEGEGAQELLTQGTGEMTPDQVREILKNTGASETMLAEIDDATLMSMFSETVSETGIDPSQMDENANAGAEGDEFEYLLEDGQQITGDTFEELTNLTVEEIRELLIASGADPEALAEIDDETLQAVYLEALAEEQFTTQNNQTPDEILNYQDTNINL